MKRKRTTAMLNATLPAHRASALVPVNLKSARAVRTALEIFDNVARVWGLSRAERQRLLGVSRATYRQIRIGKVRAGLWPKLVLRISHVLRIYAGLAVLLPVSERAHGWIRRPNSAPLFAGATALQLMTSGGVAGLRSVADYLDAQWGHDPEWNS